MSDVSFMPKRSSRLPLRRRRAELVIDVEARGGPAIAAVLVVLRWLP
jgi:tRNA threonylcarbamoyladenosine modification (KEOPS) complex  Pcc1 subunit